VVEILRTRPGGVPRQPRRRKNRGQEEPWEKKDRGHGWVLKLNQTCKSSLEKKKTKNKGRAKILEQKDSDPAGFKENRRGHVEEEDAKVWGKRSQEIKTSAGGA